MMKRRLVFHRRLGGSDSAQWCQTEGRLKKKWGTEGEKVRQKEEDEIWGQRAKNFLVTKRNTVNAGK